MDCWPIIHETPVKHSPGGGVFPVKHTFHKETTTMTIGDVLAVIAAVLLVGSAWAATILVVALAFPARVARAGAKLTAAPGRCAGRGFGVMLAVGLLAAVSVRTGRGRSSCWRLLILGAAGVVAALGSAAMVRLLGERIDAMGSPMAPFASLTRASVLYVAAGFLPVIGWFFVLPAALLLSVGAAASPCCARRRSRRPVAYAPTSLAETIAMNATRRRILGVGRRLVAAGLLSGCESLEQRFTKEALPADALPPDLPAAVACRAPPEPGRLRPAPRRRGARRPDGRGGLCGGAACAGGAGRRAVLTWRLRGLADMLDPDTGPAV